MFYLVSQMALFLVLAAAAGVVAGWWLYRIHYRIHRISLSDGSAMTDSDDMFTVKRRLDNCFDDNTKLRRELKSARKQLSNHTAESVTDGTDEDRVKVLLDDLQLRDDTILALERELERVRGN